MSKKKTVNIYDDFTTGETPEQHRKDVFKEAQNGQGTLFHAKQSAPLITTIQRSSKAPTAKDDPMEDFTERCYK